MMQEAKKLKYLAQKGKKKALQSLTFIKKRQIYLRTKNLLF